MSRSLRLPAAPGPRRTVIIGSTGSIGRQALDVARRHRERFEVVGLAAGRDTLTLLEQAGEFRPGYCGLADQAMPCMPAGVTMFTGPDAAEHVIRAAQPQLVVNAVSGMAGLAPTLAALRPGVTVAMASKEPMVALGDVLRRRADATGAHIYPVDSETTAVAQCLSGVQLKDVARVHITASGGPLWGRDPRTFRDVKPEEAVSHPKWSMGRKISVDSATMFNKGLEVTEVARLFGLPLAKVSILVHQHSLAHALVELCDGSIMAQLGPTDMRVSIAQAMFWPERPPDAPVRLSLDGVQLGFVRPDLGPWPCLRAALCAAGDGGTASAAVSAADEVLVQAFLTGTIGFNDIGRGLWAILADHRNLASRRGPTGGSSPGRLVDPVLAAIEVDAWARGAAASWVAAEGRGDPGRLPQEIGEDYPG